MTSNTAASANPKMASILLPLIDKCQLLQRQADRLLIRLQEFGWYDTRTERTAATTVSMFADFNEEQTVPETVRIPNDFIIDYHQWYASILALIEANMPSRLNEVIGLHERDHRKKDGEQRIVDYLNHGRFSETEQYRIAQYITQLAAIVCSIPHYMESRLFDIEIAVANHYVGDQLREAEILLKAGHVRAAGAIAGVLLERHLRLLCDHHTPPITYGVKDGISKLNDKLRDATVFDTIQWRKVQWMGDVRNECDHQKTSEPRREDIEALIGEVRKFTALFTV